MGWGLAILAVAVVIGWRRPRVDKVAVGGLFVAIALMLAYEWRSLGG